MDDTQVVTKDNAVAVTEEGSVMQLITRMASDPALDTDKLKTLIELQERMVAKKAEADFNDALNACQSEVGFVKARETNSQTRSKYATFAQLDHALRPIYTKHGISISYGTEDTPKPDTVRVIAHVSRGGYTRIYRVDMPADGKGAKGGDVMTKTHATGAAMAYGSRYLLKGIFNVAVGEEDTDGNGAERRGMPEGQLADFHAAIDALTDEAAAAELWKKITASTTLAGDVPANDELRSAMLAKRRGFKK